MLGRMRESTLSPLWIPALVAAVLGVYQLGEQSLWIDEGLTVANVTGSSSSLWDELHWLYYATLKPWFAIAGTSEIAVRLPSVAGAIAAVLLLYGLARRLYDRRVAFVAALLLAAHPLVVQWSQQARGYTLLVALVIAATWLLVHALDRDTVGAWAIYGLAVLVVIVWHVLSALVFLPVHVVFAWRSKRARFVWYSVVVVLLPWFALVATRPPDRLPTIWVPDLTAQYAGRTLLEISGAMGAGLLLALVGAFYAAEPRRLLVAWAFLPLAVAAVFSLYDSVFLSRYLIVAVPGFSLLGGVALVALAGNARLAAATVMAVGTVVGLAVWYSPDGSANWQGEDWRAATAFVMQRGGAEIQGASPTAYTYYGGHVARTGWILERRPRGGFRNRQGVYRYFGEKLRVVKVPRTPNGDSAR